jgi:hypothetical protein
MQGSKQAAAFVKGAVHWLCAAAGREAVSQPEVTAALLAPNMVQPAAAASDKRRWAWEPTTQKLAGSGVCGTNGAKQLMLAARLAAAVVQHAVCKAGRAVCTPS